jgi:hypothetical protein
MGHFTITTITPTAWETTTTNPNALPDWANDTTPLMITTSLPLPDDPINSANPAHHDLAGHLGDAALTAVDGGYHDGLVAVIGTVYRAPHELRRALKTCPPLWDAATHIDEPYYIDLPDPDDPDYYDAPVEPSTLDRATYGLITGQHTGVFVGVVARRIDHEGETDD